MGPYGRLLHPPPALTNINLQLHMSQYKQKTQHPSHPLHKHNILQQSKAANHLVTKGTNKILHTPHHTVALNTNTPTRVIMALVNSITVSIDLFLICLDNILVSRDNVCFPSLDVMNCLLKLQCRSFAC